MPGILDQYDPQNAGILGLAGGYLANAGPSYQPVSVSSAFGHGLLTSQQAMNQARQLAILEAYRRMQAEHLAKQNDLLQQQTLEHAANARTRALEEKFRLEHPFELPTQTSAPTPSPQTETAFPTGGMSTPQGPVGPALAQNQTLGGGILSGTQPNQNKIFADQLRKRAAYYMNIDPKQGLLMLTEAEKLDPRETFGTSAQPVDIGGKPSLARMGTLGTTMPLSGFSPPPHVSWQNAGNQLLPLRTDIAGQAPVRIGVSPNTAYTQGMENLRADPFGFMGLPRGGLGGPSTPAGQAVGQPNQSTMAAVSKDLHGPELLKALPQPIADQVKALAEGRMQFPAGFALKSPYWQQMISMVSQYDPSFDAVNYNSRASTRKDFTSGKASEQIRALNTVTQHIGQLSGLVDALKNSDFQTYNSIANSLKTKMGWTGKTDFDTVAPKVAEELTRAWRGAGGAEADIKRDIDVISSSNSPQQLHSSLANLGGLLEGQLDSLKAKYEQGMGTTAQTVQVVMPAARATLDKLRLKASKSAPQTSTIFDQADAILKGNK